MYRLEHHLSIDVASNNPNTLHYQCLKSNSTLFWKSFKSDISLEEKLKAAASPEAAIEIAKEAGFAITADDIQSMQSATAELSDEKLEGAAGGFEFVNYFLVVCSN